ncbi:MAG: PilN domain-containing protein [Acidobacteria bacterium]|nr:PilN domain-containing protein [Acidobacteriota bacterium]
MIRINLLSVDRERVKRRPAFQLAQRLIVACSLILLATALGIGWWYWSINTQSARLDEEIGAAQRETQVLRALIRQVEEFELRRSQLQERVALIEQLRRGQSEPVHLLDQISRSLPDMLWLTEIKQQGNTLAITGRCTALTALSDFVTNLEASGYFKRPVEIVDSQVEAGPAGAGELIRVSVKAQFAPPGS